MSNMYEVYRGGYPALHSRRSKFGQRGSGFFSALKRFVLPIAKKLLPHAAGAVSDLVSGRSLKDTLKSRAAEAGADVIESAASAGASSLRNLGKSINGGNPSTSQPRMSTSRQEEEVEKPMFASKNYKRKTTAPVRKQTVVKRRRINNKWQ